MITIRRGQRYTSGFTIVEIIVVIVIIGILAALGTVAYNGLQKRAAGNAVLSDIENASAIVEQYAAKNNGQFPDNTYLQANLTKSSGVNISIVLADNSGSTNAGSTVYSNLTAVQNGVLFQKTCQDLMGDPNYTTIHGSDGYGNNQTATVQINCKDNIAATVLQVTGWQSVSWNTPVTKTAIQSYMSSVPTDSYWYDRQTVVRTYYQTLMDRFEAQGGTFPVTSFWDPWANQWDGVPYQALPALPPPSTTTQPNELTKSYCVIGTSAKYSDIIYSFSSSELKAKQGNCS